MKVHIVLWDGVHRIVGKRVRVSMPLHYHVLIQCHLPPVAANNSASVGSLSLGAFPSPSESLESSESSSILLRALVYASFHHWLVSLRRASSANPTCRVEEVVEGQDKIE